MNCEQGSGIRGVDLSKRKQEMGPGRTNGQKWILLVSGARDIWTLLLF